MNGHDWDCVPRVMLGVTVPESWARVIHAEAVRRDEYVSAIMREAMADWIRDHNVYSEDG